MQKSKLLFAVLVIVGVLTVSGSVFAGDDESRGGQGDDFVAEPILQQIGGSNGGGGADIILFDLVNTAFHEARSGQGGTGSTYTVWRGSDPY
ncbi:MAG: hypothetical protein RLP44_03825 [Aggregatilineales bacterium]